jgi:hypothetical protein
MGYLTCAFDGTAIDWSSTAAWVQAIGTVIAIGASFWVVNHQHKKEWERQNALLKAERDTQLEVLEKQSNQQLVLLEEQKNAEADAGRVKLKGQINALRTELKICADQCEVYVVQAKEHDHLSPAYRLPTLARDHVIPRLLEEGALQPDTIRAVAQFYTDAASFNWGLDKLDETLRDPEFIRKVSSLRSDREASFSDVLQNSRREADRILTKAMHLIPQNSTTRELWPDRTIASRYDSAEAALVNELESMSAAKFKE